VVLIGLPLGGASCCSSPIGIRVSGLSLIYSEFKFGSGLGMLEFRREGWWWPPTTTFQKEGTRPPPIVVSVKGYKVY